MINKVEISSIQTSSLPKMKQDEVEKMLIKVKNGDEELKSEFIKCNLRLVLSVLQKFNYRKENMDDLFQIGCIGLIKAVDNFDFKYNVKFSTYAVPMIIGEIKRYLRDNSMLRVSRSLKDIAYRALKLKEQHPEKNLSNEDIAKELDISIKQLEQALDSLIEPISLFDSIYSDSGENIIVLDQIRDYKNCEENWISNISLAEAIKSLTDKERGIINRRYYQGRTQVEVAEELGISQAQISRIEKNALAKIKKQI